MQQTKASTFVNMNQLIPEYTCPQCGKRFVMSVGTDIKHYTYKMMNGRRVQYMCSYHCFRAAVKADETKQAERKEARRNKMKEVFIKNATQYRERKAAQA